MPTQYTESTLTNTDCLDRQPVSIDPSLIDFEEQPPDQMVGWIIDHGLMSPLAVVPTGARYRLVAGRRRLAALRCLLSSGHWVWDDQSRQQRPASEVFGSGVPCLVLLESEL